MQWTKCVDAAACALCCGSASSAAMRLLAGFTTTATGHCVLVRIVPQDCAKQFHDGQLLEFFIIFAGASLHTPQHVTVLNRPHVLLARWLKTRAPVLVDG